MKTERELFEEWCINDDEFCIHRYDGDDDYSDDYTQCAWLAWQASANREGYKLAPIKATEEMIDAGVEESSVDWKRLSYAYQAMINAI